MAYRNSGTNQKIISEDNTGTEIEIFLRGYDNE